MANTTHANLAEEAAAFIAESESANESLGGSGEEIRRQSDRLVYWANQKGAILQDDYTAGLERLEYDSSEHVVFYREADNRAVKRTFPGFFGYAHGLNGKLRPATPLFYLQRWLLMNHEFPTDIRLEGVGIGSPRFTGVREKEPYMVISQHWIEAIDENNPYPSEEQIAERMSFLGFRQSEDSYKRWFRDSDRILISDAKENNFIFSHDGPIPIDLLISTVNLSEEFVL
jgi:hypothetical protein